VKGRERKRRTKGERKRRTKGSGRDERIHNMEVRMVDQRSPEQSGETRKYQKGIKHMQKGSCQNGSRVGVLGCHWDGVQGLAHRGTGKEILKEITPASIYIYKLFPGCQSTSAANFSCTVREEDRRILGWSSKRGR
jgi:hypothetical protein